MEGLLAYRAFSDAKLPQLDTIMVCKAHGIKVPVEFEDPTVLETLETAVVHEWCAHLENKNTPA